VIVCVCVTVSVCLLPSSLPISLSLSLSFPLSLLCGLGWCLQPEQISPSQHPLNKEARAANGKHVMLPCAWSTVKGALVPAQPLLPPPLLAAFPPPHCPLPSSPCGHSHKFLSHYHLKGRASWPLSVGEYQVGEGLGAASLLRSPQPPGPGRPHADSPPTTSTICRRTGPR